MPAIFSKTFAPALRQFGRNGLFSMRKSSTVAAPMPKRVVRDTSEGFLQWERDVSRDSKAAKPQRLGDTPYSFATRRLGHAFEVYPLFGIVSFWVVILGYSIYAASNKLEVWFDRSQSEAPHDWARARDTYYKLHTVLFDPKNQTHQRLPIMEQLQDEMFKAAQARGTRPS
ncbi:hypothetical protein M3Y97_00630100 [Aphelenchoides bicaudatus]|nr:hypothetical protein M3Y97_00630100 [Aphelenchoides bicaudatus]